MHNIKIEDLCKFKFLSNIQFDSKGNNGCFIVHEANTDREKYDSNLWIYTGNNKECYQLTNFDNENNFIWLSDNKHILFSTVRTSEDKKKIAAGEEFTQYYKINIYGGEAKKAFRIDRKVKKVMQLDENNYVFVSTYNFNKAHMEHKVEADYEVLDEIHFWNNGEGFTNKNRNRLYIYNSYTNKHEALTDEYMNVESFNINKDRNEVIFIGQRYKNKMEVKNHIYICDLDSKKIEQISSDERFLYSYANFIETNKVICTGSDMKKYGDNENHKFYLIDLFSKKRELLTPDFDCSLWNTIGSDCRYGASPTMKIYGEHLYFITTEGSCSYLNKIDSKGNIEKVIMGSGSVDAYDIKSNKILFIGLRGKRLQEIYEFEDNKEKRISQFNEWVQNERKIASLEKITVKSAAGIEIDGWVMKPVDFDENKKYPAILNIHGGPKSAFGEVFFHEMQYWASKEYVVFFCNPRGSNGKNDAFSDIRGKFGTIDYDDFMKFTDEVLKKCFYIDKERVGVTGGSYGGYMTNWIIGHTNRFKAAVSQRSISNWITMFGTSDIGYYWVEYQNAATLWSDITKLWDCSPLKYANNVTTPTLFINSDRDFRCFYAQGLEMFTALKYNNVESKFCMFKDENHELSRSGRPKQRIGRLKEITKWFDKYLKC
ncbi:alpha/beta hydrolase family protein [Haloimpatiens sp. FM7330]|uniref:alpha/beta hydrolase family protein n=1 Tax=Haloimpatiens sp. FM7330 TaxID=3298610 RepID=UPI0036409B38